MVLPQAIRSDNGSPFAQCARALGLSPALGWWVAPWNRSGTRPPGHPQDNGPRAIAFGHQSGLEAIGNRTRRRWMYGGKALIRASA